MVFFILNLLIFLWLTKIPKHIFDRAMGIYSLKLLVGSWSMILGAYSIYWRLLFRQWLDDGFITTLDRNLYSLTFVLKGRLVKTLVKMVDCNVTKVETEDGLDLTDEVLPYLLVEHIDVTPGIFYEDTLDVYTGSVKEKFIMPKDAKEG